MEIVLREYGCNKGLGAVLSTAPFSATGTMAHNYDYAGGEIGLYNPDKLVVEDNNKALQMLDDSGVLQKLNVNSTPQQVESSMTEADLAKLGLESTDLQVFNKNTKESVASRTEKSSFWTTAFAWFKKGKGEELYSVNTFTFKDEKSATSFYKKLDDAQKEAGDYEHNHNESIDIKQDKNKVIITWGE